MYKIYLMTTSIKKVRPAECVIIAFGGLTRTAKILGYRPDAVRKWVTRKGFVPTNAQEIALIKSRELNINLTAEELILGRYEQ